MLLPAPFAADLRDESMPSNVEVRNKTSASAKGRQATAGEEIAFILTNGTEGAAESTEK